MASPSIKSSKHRTKGKSLPLPSLEAMPLLARRLVAWTVEVYFLTASAVIPYSVGVYIESRSPVDRVPLNPVLANTERAIAQTLGLPRRQGRAEVAPLTNLLWWVALASPIALTGWQIYILSKTGRTLPKRWLGVRVMTIAGKPPGFLRIAAREGVFKWSLPFGTAYLLWRFTGAFPNLALLVGLTGIIAIAEASTILLPSRRRPFHDLAIGTVVVDAKAPARRQRVPEPDEPVAVEVQRYEPRSVPNKNYYRLPPGAGSLNPLVLSPESEDGQKNLWLWMRQHPGTTLLICTLTGMTFVLATFVVTQVYIQDKADRRQTESEKNEAFLTLVDRLSATATDPLAERKSVILAMARIDDPRAVPLLVDLLGQETNPELMDAIAQALESAGLKALPALRQLNQSLSNQLQSLSLENAAKERQLVASRLKASKTAIAQLIVLSNGQLSSINLQRTDLGGMVTETGDFSLVLDRTDISGTNFRGTLLSQASFRGSIFTSAGEDKLLGTFDDAIADLSGADLRETDLSDAFLSYASLEGANLMLATLNRANFSRAQLKSANLSSTQLLETNFNDANLEKASLTGADLAAATFVRANLQRAKLGQVRAIAANFSGAKLSQSVWNGADLSEVNFNQANLDGADLSSTQLMRANFRNASLQNVNFANANLSNTDLRGANVAGANFQGVIFAMQPPANSGQFIETNSNAGFNAKIDGVDFTDVKNLTSEQIKFVCANGGYHPQCSVKKQ